MATTTTPDTTTTPIDPTTPAPAAAPTFDYDQLAAAIMRAQGNVAAANAAQAAASSPKAMRTPPSKHLGRRAHVYDAQGIPCVGICTADYLDGDIERCDFVTFQRGSAMGQAILSVRSIDTAPAGDLSGYQFLE